MAKFKDNQNQVAASYLGGLRSELDDEVTIDSSFSSLELAFGLVRSAYVSKKLTAVAAAELFRSLYIRSADGADWTLGSSTATWYRKDPGSKWVAASAPVGVTVDSKNLSGWIYDGIEKDLSEAILASADKISPDETGLAAKPSMVISQNDMRDSTDTRSASYNYTIFGSTGATQEQNLDWLDEEWELAGADAVNEHLSGTSHPYLSKVPESVVTEDVKPIIGDKEISSNENDRSGHFNPEEFFLKEGQ